MHGPAPPLPDQGFPTGSGYGGAQADAIDVLFESVGFPPPPCSVCGSLLSLVDSTWYACGRCQPASARR
jgi:hypothetical protein